MPSGTQDWKGCATLQLIFIPLCLFHHIGSHINVHMYKAGNHSKGTNMQYSRCYFKSYDIMKMSKNYML